MRSYGIPACSIFLGGLISTQGLPAPLITFDELSERPLDGVSLKGVTFGFTGTGNYIPVALFATTLLSYGETMKLDPPWAAGPSSGMMTLEFDTAIDSLGFAAGLSTTLQLAVGYSVQLFDGNGLIASIDTPTFPATQAPFAFSEASFSWSDPGQAVTSAIITFDTSAAENFALDNLAFTPIPEPTTLTLLGLGSLAFLRMRKLRTICA